MKLKEMLEIVYKADHNFNKLISFEDYINLAIKEVEAERVQIFGDTAQNVVPNAVGMLDIELSEQPEFDVMALAGIWGRASNRVHRKLIEGDDSSNNNTDVTTITV